MAVFDGSGQRVRADITPMDRVTGWDTGGAQEFEDHHASHFGLNARAEDDLAIRVEAPGWSEVPIPIGRDRIPPFTSMDEMMKAPVAITAEPAAPFLWTFHPPTVDRGDYVVLRTAAGHPIRTFAVTDTRFVTSFLPAGTYLWTLHRSTGKEIGRVSRTIDPGTYRAPVDVRLDG